MSDKDLYCYTFTSFIQCFDDIYDVKLYNKLYHTSTTRITKTINQEAGMWDRRRRVGVTPTSYANELMRDIVTDISQKTIFSKSAIVFIHVCMDKAIRNTLIQPDKYDFTEMVMEPSDAANETISKFDRWQTDKSNHSQRDRIHSAIAVKDAINRMGKEFGLRFDKMDSKDKKDRKLTKELRDEFEFYCEKLKKPLHDTQIYFIQLYYCARMECSEDTKVVEFTDIVKLIMIMKRDLMQRGYTYMPFFISGKVDASAGKKYNKRKIEKLITSHPLYEDWIGEYPDTDGLLNKDKLLNEVKTVVTCPIVVVDFEYSEMHDQLMKPVEVCVVDEIMRFYCAL